MNRISLPLFLSAFLAACTAQNQLILDPFYEGESLMVQDEQAIAEFEQIMADVPTPENKYKLKQSARAFFDSPDVLSTTQDTQPTLGICRTGDKEYYYHIEETPRGILISDLDLGITDYVITPEKFEQIRDFIRIHTPVPPELQEENKQPGETEEIDA